MKVFETTFIVNPQADDATIDRQVKSVADIITGNGGKILHENRMGTRKLAYDIGRLSQGYYSQFIFQAPNPALTALQRHYKLSEEFIRHLTIRLEGDIERLKEERANRQQASDDRQERFGRFGRGDRDRDDRDDRDDRGGRGDRGDRGDRDSRDYRDDRPRREWTPRPRPEAPIAKTEVEPKRREAQPKAEVEEMTKPVEGTPQHDEEEL